VTVLVARFLGVSVGVFVAVGVCDGVAVFVAVGVAVCAFAVGAKSMIAAKIAASSA
jgi:hypothetical protein